MATRAPQGFEEVTKAKEISPIDLHPRGNAGEKFRGRDLPPYSGSDGLESNFVRCKQCGFIVNRKVNQPGSGWVTTWQFLLLPCPEVRPTLKIRCRRWGARFVIHRSLNNEIFKQKLFGFRCWVR